MRLAVVVIANAPHTIASPTQSRQPMARDSDPIVFSTDGSHLTGCPTCGQHPCVCPAVADLVPAATKLTLRLDKKGRRGKAVTLLSGLPPAGGYAAGLLKKLKSHCGTGGAIKDGLLEIQGDQRDKVQTFLEGLGFPVRRAGG